MGLPAELQVLIDERSLGPPAPWAAPAAAHFTPGRGDGLDPAQVALAEIANSRAGRAAASA